MMKDLKLLLIDLLDFNFLNKEEIRDRTLEAILSLSEAKS